MSVAGSRRLFQDSAEAASGQRESAPIGMNKEANPESNVARMQLAESGWQAKVLLLQRFICARPDSSVSSMAREVHAG